MLLSPHEQEKLLLHVAAQLAWQRRSRGLRLNYPEAVAILSSWVLEGARDGRGVAELMSAGQHVLTADDVLEGVPEMVTSVQIEATFPDGTKLVTVHRPIQGSSGTTATLHGSSTHGSVGDSAAARGSATLGSATRGSASQGSVTRHSTTHTTGEIA